MRTFAATLALGVLLTPALVAQDQRPAALVYEAYFQINYADLEEWNETFRRYSEPILRDLQQEGVIQGFTINQHQTGGTHNWRQAIRLYDWASSEAFWSAYLSRVAEVTGEEENVRISNMIAAHHDEIWNIGSTNISGGGQFQYHTAYRVGFGNMEEWNRLVEEVLGPVMTALSEEGLAGGWVRLDHNTGASHNTKLVVFFPDLGTSHDFFAQLETRLAEQHPTEFRRILELIRSHEDYVWAPVPPAGN